MKNRLSSIILNKNNKFNCKFNILNNVFLIKQISTINKFNSLNTLKYNLKNKNNFLNSKTSIKYFSETNESNVSNETTIDIQPEIIQSNTENMSFKAETKRILDIVTHSLYTDKEVFLRELLSNCSDALEKQRYLENTGKLTVTGEPLEIKITTNEKNKTLIIFDSGVGMTRQEMIDNLGTIARSGTQNFVKDLSNNKENEDSLTKSSSAFENLIGQFGVGFYSSFIIGDQVEVISKKQTDNKAYHWISDGSGEFQISDVENCDFARGTKIIIHLKPECRDFSKSSEIIKTAKKYSSFISYSIKINGEKINDVQAIWYRDKKEITSEEYQRFFELMNNNTKLPYKYLIHFSTDIPRDIKTIMYIPKSNPEKFGMNSEEAGGLSLYSKKVLIKAKCVELLPRYLRFMRGVVDCSDIPLSISRESYQDSSIINKLKTILTKRVIKKLDDELKLNPKEYDSWYDDFCQYIREGLLSEDENNESLLRLLRFTHNLNQSESNEKISIEDYIKKMVKDQNKIYFYVVSSDKSGTNNIVKNNVYLEQFEGTDLPILISNQPIDEMIFKKLNQYKDFKFLNIENESDDFLDKIRESKGTIINKIPEDDLTPYTNWIKTELEPHVGTVKISKRLSNTPLLVSSEMSSNMKGFMALMNQNMDPSLLIRDLNLEINPSNDIIVNLNELRKLDIKTASLTLKLIFDAALSQSNLGLPNKEFVNRAFNVAKQFINLKLNTEKGEVIDNKNNEIKLERMTEDNTDNSSSDNMSKFEELKKN